MSDHDDGNPPFPLTSPVRSVRIPPLEQGDRLDREEYLRRYAAMPEHIKAERIEGMVYMAAAATSADFHAFPHANLMFCFTSYQVATPGVQASDNGTIHLDLDNDPQPDGGLLILPSHGGQTRIDSNGFIVGATELVAEISGSSVSYDLNTKLNVYRRNGVREYLVHRGYDGQIDWFSLSEGQYVPLPPDAEGIVRSQVFPGLWLKPAALVSRDMTEVFRVLQMGLATEEHSQFATRLAVKKA